LPLLVALLWLGNATVDAVLSALLGLEAALGARARGDVAWSAELLLGRMPVFLLRPSCGNDSLLFAFCLAAPSAVLASWLASCENASCLQIQSCYVMFKLL
jgi:hypothetical protein